MKVITRLMTAVALASGNDSLVSNARRGESSHSVAGALTLASTEEGLALTPDDLDAHPLLLNCQNGVLDLRTGTLGPHDPELQLTKLTGAAYDPDAAGPEFEKFLCRVQPDPELLNARTFAAHPTGVADLFGRGWPSCTNPTRVGGRPRAQPRGCPEATGSRRGGCAKISGRSARRTCSSC